MLILIDKFLHILETSYREKHEDTVLHYCIIPQKLDQRLREFLARDLNQKSRFKKQKKP